MTPKARYIAGGLAAIVVLVLGLSWLFYPKDTTPRGAYLRVMVAVNSGRPEAVFPYIETQAQHAAYTIHDYKKKSLQSVQRGYPQKMQEPHIAELQPFVEAVKGPGVFALYAKRRGWIQRLRQDLSGVKSVEIVDDRATVETARGTRYPFRRRENGIWGLTLFTAHLVAESEKAARDYSVIEQAAQDFQRAK